jgi:PAS domain S-box-containing protein
VVGLGGRLTTKRGKPVNVRPTSLLFRKVNLTVPADESPNTDRSDSLGLADSEFASRWWEPLVQVSLDSQFVLRPVDDDLTDFEVLYSNEPGARLGGTTPEAVMGKLLSEIAPPYGTGLRQALVDAWRTGTSVHRTTERIAPGVRTRRAEFQVRSFEGLLVLSVIDRTDEFDAEAREAEFRHLLEIGINNSPTAFALLSPVRDSEGNVVDVRIEQANGATAALLARTVAEVVDQTLYSLLEDPRGALAKLTEECLSKQQMMSVDWDFRELTVRADWLRIQLTPFGDFVVFHAEDISAQRRAQDTVREIVDHAGEIIIFTSNDGLIQYINPFALLTLGYTESELLNSSIFSLAHRDDRSAIVEEGLAALSDRSSARPRRRIRVLDKAGNIRTMLGSPRSVWALGGELSGVVTIATDITDLLASEDEREQLAAELSMAEQSQRERLVGELHDGPVQDLTALSMKVGAAISMRSNPELLFAEETLTRVIGDLRTLMFHLSPPALDGESLGQAIHQRAEHLFAGSNVNVSVQGTLLLPPTPALSVTLFRIAQEALINAFKHATATYVTVRLYDSPENEIVLEIRDDGCGAQPNQYKIHAAGHFGLNMMQRRTHALGGSYTIEGDVGQGTVVTVRIPRGST